MKLDSEDAEAILEYLETYEYASLPHVTIALFWHTMMRRGVARALDVDNYHPEEQCLEVRHRPESDTPSKNGFDGERFIGLSSWLCKLLDDWLRDRRPDVTDEYGRGPLLATQYRRNRGSISISCNDPGYAAMPTEYLALLETHRS